MMNNTFYNEILTDHNLHPAHKKKLEDANLVLEGVNPSCGDDIILELKEENGVITDGAFVGSGCAISQASVDMMLELIIGKTKEEALQLADLFSRMIKGEAKGDELEPLEEAMSLADISKMPARVKCAVLGWHTMEELLEKARIQKEEISYFFLHQANRRIIEAAAKRTGVDISRFPMNLQEYGNTSAASIPILLDEWNRKGRLQKGDKLILAGFGAGLSWAGSLLEW